MREIELPLPSNHNRREAQRAIDAAARECRLTITLRGTLAKFPGCIHWHLKNGRERGTMEITFWPKERRAWFSIQSGRRAPWIVPMTGKLRESVTANSPARR